MNDSELIAQGNGADVQIDPSYADNYIEDAQESELKVGRVPIERSDFYLVLVTGVDARLQPFEGGRIEGNLTMTAEEGPDGMVGRFINGRVVPSVGNKRKDENDKSGKKLRDATKEEIHDSKVKLNETLIRVQRVLGLATRFPAAGGVPGVKSWLKPAVGKKFLVTAYSDQNGYSNIVLDSMRLPGDPPSEKAIDPQTKKPIAGATAGEQAVRGREIEAAKAAKKAGAQPRGKTAGAFAGSNEI